MDDIPRPTLAATMAELRLLITLLCRELRDEIRAKTTGEPRR